MSNEESPLPPKNAPDVDFPIERVEAEHVSRREFAKFLCLISGGMAVGSGWVALKDKIVPPFKVEGLQFVCKVDDIPRGGTYPFHLKGSRAPFMIVHLNDGTFEAYEQRCTHLACAVYYSPENDHIECPCHHGAFDARTGLVLKGPPPRPLPRLEVVRVGDELYVREPLEDAPEPKFIRKDRPANGRQPA